MKLGLVFVLCAVACNPVPVVPSPADACVDASSNLAVDASADAGVVPSADANTSPCQSACNALLVAGCAEGSNPGCVVTCDHLVATHLVALDVVCLAKAKSSAEVRRCGVGCSISAEKHP
jgi:hypothetical protein